MICFVFHNSACHISISLYTFFMHVCTLILCPLLIYQSMFCLALSEKSASQWKFCCLKESLNFFNESFFSLNITSKFFVSEIVSVGSTHHICFFLQTQFDKNFVVCRRTQFVFISSQIKIKPARWHSINFNSCGHIVMSLLKSISFAILILTIFKCDTNNNHSVNK